MLAFVLLPNETKYSRKTNEFRACLESMMQRTTHVPRATPCKKVCYANTIIQNIMKVISSYRSNFESAVETENSVRGGGRSRMNRNTITFKLLATICRLYCVHSIQRIPNFILTCNCELSWNWNSLRIVCVRYVPFTAALLASKNTHNSNTKDWVPDCEFKWRMWQNQIAFL